ncbi:MAG: phosphate transport system regulatory protein PhoU [Deltaproteobacteria bacterium RIFOXYD12_FULL_50_9]|nr:MAG: phosphate transport system regulatory protein PhoU [Deltaproteobacteria bacterium RIFOXYD12_FULL_50_9]
MAQSLTSEIKNLKHMLLYLGTMVEDNLQKAVKAFLESNVELAKTAKEMDREIDNTEVDLEEECLRVLALHQPVAGSLRFVVTVLKINNDLERIGDLAVKIADKAELLSATDLNGWPAVIPISDLYGPMVEKTLWMYRNCLNAFIEEDADLAYKVLLMDDEVDQAKYSIRQQLEELQERDPTQYVYLGKLLGVSRCLERIADHSTNICEDIIYMLQGAIIRHELAE